MSICENCGLPITAERPGAENGLPLHRALWVCIEARKDEIERLRAENERLRELCHKTLRTLLRAGDALNWPDDVEEAITELRKTLGR